MRQDLSRRFGGLLLGLAFVTPTVAQDETASPRQIVVSLPDRKLALLEEGRIVKVYAVAIGALSTPSPTGKFRIVHRIHKPTYYTPGKVIQPGKANPLGTRWLGLSLKSFGIHGTNAPSSIGKNLSHGCIRLRNRDVEDLFERAAIGDSVEIHGEINERVAQLFGHPQEPVEKPQPEQSVATINVALAIPTK
ncbi:MAG: L,D-transpeptidase [Acidobacteria bacterium]|nr:L,D-transpeptidase [Acidobacteriota bacterium]MCI0623017.1 L,D-transpeptidase [Acidobacteriota bacterium]MCI0717475.1 L,D-transpeptidase [Acidobacteriota bacterium]